MRSVARGLPRFLAAFGIVAETNCNANRLRKGAHPKEALCSVAWELTLGRGRTALAMALGAVPFTAYSSQHRVQAGALGSSRRRWRVSAQREADQVAPKEAQRASRPVLS
jgi:hypothetical protein